MWTLRIATIIILSSLWILPARPAVADRIVLKDGTVEESDKIWTSDRYIHFILKGTRSVEIRYAIEIVERIERGVEQDESARPSGPKTDVLSPIDSSGSSSDGTDAPGKGRDAGDQVVLKEKSALLQEFNKKHREDSFYDPRRTLRYRVSETSAYRDLKSALDELGEIYGRSPEWVAEHMGEENDIRKIHNNLTARKKTELNTGTAVDERDQSPKAHSRTGLSNTSGISAGTRVLPLAKPPAAQFYSELKIDKSIKFYDPRRTKKYWTDEVTHHHSLRAAVEALANHYKVPPKWIEKHMGDSNLLIDIHKSIRNSLKQD